MSKVETGTKLRNSKICLKDAKKRKLNEKREGNNQVVEDGRLQIIKSLPSASED